MPTSGTSHSKPCHGIESSERLVHQQKPWLVDEDTRDLDALLHAPGQLAGIAISNTVQTDQIEHFLHLDTPLLAVEAAYPVVEGNIVTGILAWKSVWC